MPNIPNKQIDGQISEPPFNWTCPFCQRDVTITSPNIYVEDCAIPIEHADGPREAQAALIFILCPNKYCLEYTLEVKFCEFPDQNGQIGEVVTEDGKMISKHWRLIPPSDAKAFPPYIPKPLRDDYTEACQIKDASPKAAATLARRCLQGMIRDFWKDEVTPGKLSNEIRAIEDKVDRQTWDAIDAVREIGNIGAHMEKDVNVIVDVEPREAEALIELLEFLFKEWYINQKEREKQLEELKNIASQKKEAKKK